MQSRYQLSRIWDLLINWKPNPLNGSYVTAIWVIDSFQSFINQGFLNQFIDSINSWWDGHLDGTGGSAEIRIEGMGEKIGLFFCGRIEPECGYVSGCYCWQAFE
jgi:hypothetical protein